MTIVGGAAAVAAAGLKPAPAASVDHKRYGDFFGFSDAVLYVSRRRYRSSWTGSSIFCSFLRLLSL